jgi:chaperonin cofactor prefoldin
MNDFVTRAEFQRLETTVDTIEKKVDNIQTGFIRMEENLRTLPERVLAEIAVKLYDGNTRIAVVEKSIDSANKAIKELQDFSKTIKDSNSWTLKEILKPTAMVAGVSAILCGIMQAIKNMSIL